MAQKISSDHEKEFRNGVLKEIEEKVYRISIDLKQDVEKVLGMEKNNILPLITKDIEETNKELDRLKSQKTAFSKERTKELKLNLQGFRFRFDQTSVKFNELYKIIDQNGRTIEALWKEWDFVIKFDSEEMPQVPFIQIDGTKYAAESNRIKKDKDGNKVLYLEHGKTSDKTPAEK